MNLPKIAADDLMLFGSLLLVSVGAALVTASVTGEGWLSLGLALIVFGLPSAAVVFMAASGESK